MGKKLIAITGMEKLPTCKECRFSGAGWIDGEAVLFCSADGRPLFQIKKGDDRRDKACPLVELELVEPKPAYWKPGADSDFVMCSICQAEWPKEYLYPIASFFDMYPRYCHTCGANMANYYDGEVQIDEEVDT